MNDTGLLGILLIIANVAVSYKGFKDPAFFEKYKFEVEKINLYKDYKRFITSGFLHVNWMHLIFNMFTLLLFSAPSGMYMNAFEFLLIYAAGIAGGNWLSYLVHRHHSDYSSVGASGAVFALIFATIAIVPGFQISLLFFPLPGWLFGLLFVGFSMYGIKSRSENVGYEAHLGGALIGMVIGLIFHPTAFLSNYITILVIAVPTITFIYLIITRPHLLMIDNFFFKSHRNDYTPDHRYNQEKTNLQQEIDDILDKINSKGMGSLSRKEREKLHEYSKASR